MSASLVGIDPLLSELIVEEGDEEADQLDDEHPTTQQSDDQEDSQRDGEAARRRTHRPSHSRHSSWDGEHDIAMFNVTSSLPSATPAMHVPSKEPKLDAKSRAILTTLKEAEPIQPSQDLFTFLPPLAALVGHTGGGWLLDLHEECRTRIGVLVQLETQALKSAEQERKLAEQAEAATRHRAAALEARRRKEEQAAASPLLAGMVTRRRQSSTMHRQSVLESSRRGMSVLDLQSASGGSLASRRLLNQLIEGDENGSSHGSNSAASTYRPGTSRLGTGIPGSRVQTAVGSSRQRTASSSSQFKQAGPPPVQIPPALQRSRAQLLHDLTLFNELVDSSAAIETATAKNEARFRKALVQRQSAYLNQRLLAQKVADIAAREKQRGTAEWIRMESEARAMNRAAERASEAQAKRFLVGMAVARRCGDEQREKRLGVEYLAAKKLARESAKNRFLVYTSDTPLPPKKHAQVVERFHEKQRIAAGAGVAGMEPVTQEPSPALFAELDYLNAHLPTGAPLSRNAIAEAATHAVLSGAAGGIKQREPLYDPTPQRNEWESGAPSDNALVLQQQHQRRNRSRSPAKRSPTKQLEESKEDPTTTQPQPPPQAHVPSPLLQLDPSEIIPPSSTPQALLKLRAPLTKFERMALSIERELQPTASAAAADRRHSPKRAGAGGKHEEKDDPDSPRVSRSGMVASDKSLDHKSHKAQTAKDLLDLLDPSPFGAQKDYAMRRMDELIKQGKVTEEDMFRGNNVAQALAPPVVTTPAMTSTNSNLPDFPSSQTAGFGSAFSLSSASPTTSGRSQAPWALERKLHRRLVSNGGEETLNAKRMREQQQHYAMLALHQSERKFTPSLSTPKAVAFLSHSFSAEQLVAQSSAVLMRKLNENPALMTTKPFRPEGDDHSEGEREAEDEPNGESGEPPADSHLYSLTFDRAEPDPATLNGSALLLPTDAESLSPRLKTRLLTALNHAMDITDDTVGVSASSLDSNGLTHVPPVEKLSNLAFATYVMHQFNGARDAPPQQVFVSTLGARSSIQLKTKGDLRSSASGAMGAMRTETQRERQHRLKRKAIDLEKLVQAEGARRAQIKRRQELLGVDVAPAAGAIRPIHRRNGTIDLTPMVADDDLMTLGVTSPDPARHSIDEEGLDGLNHHHRTNSNSSLSKSSSKREKEKDGLPSYQLTSHTRNSSSLSAIARDLNNSGHTHSHSSSSGGGGLNESDDLEATGLQIMESSKSMRTAKDIREKRKKETAAVAAKEAELKKSTLLPALKSPPLKRTLAKSASSPGFKDPALFSEFIATVGPAAPPSVAHHALAVQKVEEKAATQAVTQAAAALAVKHGAGFKKPSRLTPMRSQMRSLAHSASAQGLQSPTEQQQQQQRGLRSSVSTSHLPDTRASSAGSAASDAPVTERLIRSKLFMSPSRSAPAVPKATDSSPSLSSSPSSGATEYSAPTFTFSASFRADGSFDGRFDATRYARLRRAMVRRRKVAAMVGLSEELRQKILADLEKEDALEWELGGAGDETTSKEEEEKQHGRTNEVGRAQIAAAYRVAAAFSDDDDDLFDGDGSPRVGGDGHGGDDGESDDEIAGMSAYISKHATPRQRPAKKMGSTLDATEEDDGEGEGENGDLEYDQLDADLAEACDLVTFDIPIGIMKIDPLKLRAGHQLANHGDLVSLPRGPSDRPMSQQQSFRSALVGVTFDPTAFVTYDDDVKTGMGSIAAAYPHNEKLQQSNTNSHAGMSNAEMEKRAEEARLRELVLKRKRAQKAAAVAAALRRQERDRDLLLLAADADASISTMFDPLTSNTLKDLRRAQVESKMGFGTNPTQGSPPPPPPRTEAAAKLRTLDALVPLPAGASVPGTSAGGASPSNAVIPYAAPDWSPRTVARRGVLTEHDLSSATPSYALTQWFHKHGKSSLSAQGTASDPRLSQKYHECFQALDVGHGGEITRDDILLALKKTHLTMPVDELEGLLRKLHLSQRDSTSTSASAAANVLVMGGPPTATRTIGHHTFVRALSATQEWEVLLEVWRERKRKLERRAREEAEYQEKRHAEGGAGGEGAAAAGHHKLQSPTGGPRSTASHGHASPALLPFLLWIPAFQRLTMLEAAMAFKLDAPKPGASVGGMRGAREELMQRQKEAATTARFEKLLREMHMPSGSSLNELWRATLRQVRKELRENAGVTQAAASQPRQPRSSGFDFTGAVSVSPSATLEYSFEESDDELDEDDVFDYNDQREDIERDLRANMTSNGGSELIKRAAIQHRREDRAATAAAVASATSSPEQLSTSAFTTPIKKFQTIDLSSSPVDAPATAPPRGLSIATEQTLEDKAIAAKAPILLSPTTATLRPFAQKNIEPVTLVGALAKLRYKAAANDHAHKVSLGQRTAEWKRLEEIEREEERRQREREAEARRLDEEEERQAEGYHGTVARPSVADLPPKSIAAGGVDGVGHSRQPSVSVPPPLQTMPNFLAMLLSPTSKSRLKELVRPQSAEAPPIVPDIDQAAVARAKGEQQARDSEENRLHRRATMDDVGDLVPHEAAPADFEVCLTLTYVGPRSSSGGTSLVVQRPPPGSVHLALPPVHSEPTDLFVTALAFHSGIRPIAPLTVTAKQRALHVQRESRPLTDIALDEGTRILPFGKNVAPGVRT